MTKFKLDAQYYFGKDVVKKYLSIELKTRKIKTILLAYGGGSIKKNGLYNQIIEACKKNNISVIEHYGIEPNPRDIGIYQASLKCRKHKVDLIIAAGGGSVIDASKIIGILATNPQYKDCWSYILDNSKVIHPSIPLFSINTLAATGSENNNASVITNAKTKHKRSNITPSANPIVCFEDPSFQLTLSKWQTACGIFDIFSHLMEQYYDPNVQFEWTKKYIIANMLVTVDCAKKLMKNLNDYDARANLLWTSSMALNGLARIETSGGDWTTHKLEHAISGLWDVEHGAGLALICPTYLKYIDSKNKLFKQYSLEIGREVFGVNSLNKYYEALIKFIKLLGLPAKYTDFKQISNVTNQDLAWLNKHFNEVMPNKSDIPKYVFSHIKK